MDISCQITVAVKPEFYKSKMKIGALQPGSTLVLKVIELKGDRALIDFGNFRTTADIKIPVTLGEELTVKVLEAGNQLKLGVITSEQKNIISSELQGQRMEILPDQNLNKIQQDLAHLLNQAADLSGGKKIPQSMFNVLASLNAHFEPFELKEIIAELLPRLKSFIDNSGIFFEKALERIITQVLVEKDGGSTRYLADQTEVKAVFNRDLKPNLLLLQQFAEDNTTLQKIFDPKTLANLKSTIDTLLGDITQQQGRAVNQLDSADPFQVFTYSLPSKEGAQQAKLKIYYEKKQKSGSQKRFQISLFLSMDQLGDIRTDFLLVENDLSITFFVTEPSTKVTIQENYSKIQKLLSSLFDQIQLKVKVSEKKVRDFDRPEVETASDKRVDIRI
jgi:hypothetical protein